MTCPAASVRRADVVETEQGHGRTIAPSRRCHSRTDPRDSARVTNTELSGSASPVRAARTGSFHTPANPRILMPRAAVRTHTSRVRALLPPEAPPATLSSTQVSGMTAAGGLSSLRVATAFAPALPATSHARPGPPARSPAVVQTSTANTQHFTQTLCLGPTLSTTVVV